MEAKVNVSVGETITMLPPEALLTDDNIRFNLKQSRVDQLAEDILESGQVNDALEAEQLPEPVDGRAYRLTVVHYRHAAVSKLNQDGAGLLLPVIIRSRGDAVARLRRQISENLDRENLSPMDQAVVIKRLLDAGVPKMEIRKLFSRPGGRKGNKVQPASNSFVNMTASFLDLPKAIQRDIHDGIIGVAAAYELTKVSPEKRMAVVERAKQEREAALEKEERDEEKFLAAEAKKEEADKKRKELEDQLAAAKAAFEQAQKDAEAKATASAEAYKAAKAKLDAEEKKQREEALKAAEAAEKEAEKSMVKAGKDLEKVQAKVKSIEEQAAERAKKLKEAREQAKTSEATKKKTAVGPQDVKKAAAAEGASTNLVPLKLQEVRAAIHEFTLPGSYAKVNKIGVALERMLSGELTPRQTLDEIAVITGEAKPKEKKAAK